MKANTTLLMSSVLLLLLLLHGGLIEGKRRGKRTDVEFNSDAVSTKNNRYQPVIINLQ